MAILFQGNGLYSGLSSDTKPTKPAGYRFFETDTGDLHISDGTYWWLQTQGPLSNKRYGTFIPGSSTIGTGMLASMTAATTPGTQASFTDDTTNGRYYRGRTLATTGSKGGIRVVSSAFTLMDWKPRMRMRIATTSTTVSRTYFGWTSTASDLTGDDPLNAITGFMFGFIPSDTNYQIMHNDGTGATVFNDTGIAKKTTLQDVRIVCDGTKWSWSVDGSAYVDVTTEIPLTGISITAQWQNETNENVLKDIRIYNVFVQSDK